MSTAINDGLTILLHEALAWLELSATMASSTVSILDNPPSSTKFTVIINGVKYTYTSGSGTVTKAAVAAGLVLALTGCAAVTATDNHDGTYGLVATGAAFSLILDSYQDIVPLTREMFIVQSFIPVAKLIADGYCNNPFTAGLPADVKTGVLQIISELYQSWKSGNGQGVVLGPIQKQDAGGLSVTYAAPISYGQFAISGLVKTILSRYRYMAGASSAPTAMPAVITFTEMWEESYTEPEDA